MGRRYQIETDKREEEAEEEEDIYKEGEKARQLGCKSHDSWASGTNNENNNYKEYFQLAVADEMWGPVGLEKLGT